MPAEAIQAEVQRQLGSLLDRLSAAESENLRLQEALHRQQMVQQATATVGEQVSTNIPLPPRGTDRFEERGQPSMQEPRSIEPWSSI